MIRSAPAQWAFGHIIEIDRHTPFCGAFFRASDERRQVIAAYLSAKPPAPEEMAKVGSFLLAADHRTILERAHGQYIEGSRGALRRAGETVHEESFYCLLHQTLAEPPHKAALRAVRGMARLDYSRLLAIWAIPEAICCAEVIEILESPASSSDATDAKAAFELLTSRGVDAERLASALRQSRSHREFAKVWETFMLTMEAPDHPVEATEFYRPVRSPKELHSLARKYRNCARRYSIDLINPDAGHAFAEVHYGQEGAVVHLEKSDAKWKLEGIYGPRNARPGRVFYRRTEQYLASHGVEIIRRQRRTQNEWDSLRRLATSGFEFGLDFD